MPAPTRAATPSKPPVRRATALSKPQRAVQSVEVGGQLLLALARQAGPLNLGELAALAGLAPARAHPYLVSFARLGLVQQDAQSGRYGLGPAALQMGLACLMQLDPLKAAEPIAQALAVRTGQAVALSVWGNLGPTVVRMIEAAQPLHVSMRVGSVMSIFGTATGRAFVAALPPVRIVTALQGPLGATGLQPRLTKTQLAAQVAPAVHELRLHGVTRAVGRPIPGVNAFSAPVWDHEGHPALVITLLGHQDHFPSAWGSPLALAVRQAAAEISQCLGASPPKARTA
jgi:DNA-binding IclR family transcriptional regulator